MRGQSKYRANSYWVLVAETYLAKAREGELFAHPCRHPRLVKWILANWCWNDTAHASSARTRQLQARDFGFLPEIEDR